MIQQINKAIKTLQELGSVDIVNKFSNSFKQELTNRKIEFTFIKRGDFTRFYLVRQNIK